MNTNQYSLTNLFIPAGGVVHAVDMSGPFSNSPEVIQWNQFKVDNFPFSPQGVYLDNTDAVAVDLVLTFLPLGWRVICKPGEQRICNFPAAQGGSVQITGEPANATAKVIFVDFPVFPDTWSK